ncbi:glycosyltransferase family 2 protein [Planktotalea sp.]|uniref:glycosyltransferase family 2 protein n=1 Tax=Planktotalea sp. TaxID=2029877 RepID=UPI003C7284B2
MTTALSLILPANNEAAHIQECLNAIMASEPFGDNAAVQIIVVPNGCSDDTANLARGFEPQATKRGWRLDVIELEQGSKLAALNAGEAIAKAPALAYLDADVVVSPKLLAETVAALHNTSPRYASGTVCISRSKSWITRAYATFYLQTPFMKQIAPGCGYFAMNKAGRARWAKWPAIISDDTFARLNFAPGERKQVSARYDWPLVEGLGNLIRVRRRQNAGVDELEHKFPELLVNDAKTRFAPLAILKAALRHPIGVFIYGLVAVTVKLVPAKDAAWDRGR